MNILIQAELRKFSPKVDGSCGLSFNAPAIEKNDLGVFYDMQGEEGWLLFSKYQVHASDIPKEIHSIEYDGKTPSKRLRDVLFVQWKEWTNRRNEARKEGKELQQMEAEIDFEVYYRRKMEKIISVQKEIIDDLIL